MDRTLALLIEHTANELGQTEKDCIPYEKDFCGFRARCEKLTDLLIAALFPRHANQATDQRELLEAAVALLSPCLELVLPVSPRSEEVILALLANLPEVRRQLETDLEAAYAGDPAARSLDEIILCYPAFTAIAVYRLAHILYRERVPLLPRVMAEYAHRLTGIDIHPGAVIGDFFFIDHGTGVVIYSGATILGGNTRIGNDCIIGGSVWLTHSVEAGKMVLARSAVTDTPLTRDIITQAALDSAML